MPSIAPLLRSQWVADTPAANVAFIAPPGTKVDIITSYAPDNPLEPWQAHATESGRVRRTQVLSAGGRTEDEALLALHLKASQAVQQFLLSNGPGYPPAHGTEYESDMDEEENCLADLNQEADAMSDWGDAFSDTSDDEGAFAPRQAHGNKVTGEHGSPDMQMSAARPRPRRDHGDGMAPIRIGEKNTALHLNDQPAGGHHARASKPQSTVDTGRCRTLSRGRGKFDVQATTDGKSQVIGQQATITPGQVNNTITVGASKTAQDNDPSAQLQATSLTTAQYPVSLTVSTSTSHSLAHHSPVYQFVTLLPAPSMQALAGSAVGYIRTMPIPGVTGARPVPTLRARVKRVKMGDVMWDMGGFRSDDLSIFFAPGIRSGDRPMPLFELEVEDATGGLAASPSTPTPDEYAGVMSV